MFTRIDILQKELESFRPFSEAELPRIRDFYRVDMTYSSNTLEGFGYTISETKILLEDGLTAGGKPLRDAYAVLGHAKAYDHMFTLLRQKNLTEADILFFHSCLTGSLANDAVAGQYRTSTAYITGSKYPLVAPEYIVQAMEKLCEFIEVQRSLLHPVEYAAQIHKQLVYIHPFADGNGRVSRLAMNTAFIQQGYIPVIIPPVLRAEYIDVLEKGHSNDRPFIEFIARCVVESQKDMLRLMRGVRCIKS